LWDLPPVAENAGAPAAANTGSLMRADDHGGFTSIVEGLDRRTSLEFLGDSAFVITLTGKVIRIDRGPVPPGSLSEAAQRSSSLRPTLEAEV